MKYQDIEKLDLTGWPLPDDYLIEVGRVSAVWASLESFLNLCIGKLESGFDDLNDPKSFILVTHASFPQRLDMLSALCEQSLSDFPHLVDYKQVIGGLKSAQKLRNKFAHNCMVLNPETQAVEMPVGSARGTLKVSVEQIEVTEIRRATMDIDEALAALYRLVLRRDIGPGWKRRASEHGASADACGSRG